MTSFYPYHRQGSPFLGTSSHLTVRLTSPRPLHLLRAPSAARSPRRGSRLPRPALPSRFCTPRAPGWTQVHGSLAQGRGGPLCVHPGLALRLSRFLTYPLPFVSALPKALGQRTVASGRAAGLGRAGEQVATPRGTGGGVVEPVPPGAAGRGRAGTGIGRGSRGRAAPGTGARAGTRAAGAQRPG